jgi:CheY-like chemotaxis protein
VDLYTCLLIDDDRDDHEFFEMALRLKQSELRCICIDDGIKALERLKNGTIGSPKLIFIDINMPRMNGMQCLAEIKAETHLRDIPVYMYSTSAEPAIVDECLNMGAAGFLKKEVSIPDLENKISQILRKLKGSVV